MEQTETQDETVPAFAYELLRNILIPELLGKEQPAILYWSGKNLARQYPLDSSEEIVQFFTRAGWGNLTVDTEGKNKINFSLEPGTPPRETKKQKAASFELEAGFLAQQIEQLKNRFADANSSVKRGRTVSITVEWDQKDPVNKTR